MLDCLEPVVWTSKGPCLSDNFEHIRTNLRSRGMIQVIGIEPLPRMVDYVVPSGVTNAEADRVRLGAYLAPGTSVIREGYVSYNAGTLGPAQIEGRLFSAVTIGEGTRNGQPLAIGRDYRLNHGSGTIGVDLGDNCELGLGVLATKGTLLYDARVGHQIHAHAIAGRSSLLICNEPFSNSPVLREKA